jgi:PAS domain S-box-containing protein
MCPDAAVNGPVERLGQRLAALWRGAALRALLRGRGGDREVLRQMDRRAEEFEALFRNSPAGLAISTDPSCGTVQHNAAMDRLLGGPHQADALRVLHQGRQLRPGQQPLQRACASGQAVHAMELEVHADGRPPVFLLASAVPLTDGSGNPRGAISAAMDITELKTTQARLLLAHEALRASHSMIELVRQTGHLGFFEYRPGDEGMMAGPGLRALLGVEAGRGFGRLVDWLRCVDSADRRTVRRTLVDAMLRRQPHATVEFRAAHAVGPPARWISCRLALRYGADGRLEQMSGLALDISPHKESERLRQREAEREQLLRYEAERASRAKDEFLSMLSHELRNPLGAVIAAAEVITTGAGGPGGTQRAAAIIQRQTQHLAQMMHDLLDVSRAVTNKLVLKRSPLDMAELVSSAVSMLEATGVVGGRPLRLSLSQAWVDADATRIEQAVSNLVANACRHSTPGGAIEVSVREESGSAVLQVRDAGPGIPDALLPHIFELFVQGDRSLDRPGGGLGVGLTLARRSVELHGGTLTAASSPEGSVFTLRLALVGPPPAGVLAAGGRIGSPRKKPHTVLLIEDNADVREAVEAMLLTQGHRVDTADDGLAGLAKLHDTWPAIAVVDIGLPSIDGFNVARRAREAGYPGRMVAMSGYGHAAQDALRAGFDTFLVKPVNAAALAAALESS